MGYALPATESSGSVEKGVVIGVGKNSLLVKTSFGAAKAERAAGCLLAPQAGDEVLTAVLPNGEVWVTCVLTRAGGEANETNEAKIDMPQNTRLCAENLIIENGSTQIISRNFSVKGALLSLSGGVLSQSFGAIHTAAGRLYEKIVRRFGRYSELSQLTDGLEDRTAGRMRIASRSSYRVRSQSADVRAKSQLNLDAESIKVG